MAKRVLLSYSDLESFPDDGLRRELLGGELFVTPSRAIPHQRAVTRVWAVLDAYARKHGGEAFVAPLDVVFGEHDVAEPDVLYVGPERMSVLGGRVVEGPPSLVVEILSPSTSTVDRTRKRAVYAAYGVPEYWIVDLDARAIERNSDPQEGRYRTIVVFDDEMPAATLPGLIVSIDDVIC